MLIANNGAMATPTRLVVFAYDVASARRARRLRKLLWAVRHGSQYSVHEVLLDMRAFSGLLAELTECCRLDKDSLAVWWPRRAIRFEWNDKTFVPLLPGGEAASMASESGAGNYVVCYDISDPDSLAIVGAKVAAEGSMVQRSVYWLRVPERQLKRLAMRCAQHLSQKDRLWAYPLRGARDLWIVGERQSSLMPVAADRWGTAS